MKNFYDFFIRELRDIYNSELHLLKALPQMAAIASSSKLKKAFSLHYEETQGQVERLKKMGDILKKNLEGTVCKAMQGLIAEEEDILNTAYEKDTKDAALISAAQRIEHYEIAAYSSLKVYARHLLLEELETLLSETLKEEIAADKKLTKIAEGTLFHAGVNAKASSHCCSNVVI